MNVPFLDLKVQYHAIKTEVDTAISHVLEDAAFVLGKYVEQFESEFARYIGVKHAVGLNSGTAALHLALLAMDIKQGDEVITVPNTFFATAEAVSLVGAKPVFVDIDEATFNMDAKKLEKAITKKTKAIIPVHLYGQPVDMNEIQGIADKHGIPVVEDACQAVGAKYNGKKAGSLGKVGCFSFYPGKNLGACGEGGMVTTNDDHIAAMVRLYRAHGENPKNNHRVVGYNYRMEGIQGAVLSAKLNHLDAWTKKRQENAAYYTKILGNADVTLPAIAPNRKHVFHLYVIRSRQRDALKAHLEAKGIGVGIHYLKPIHLQEAYAHLGLREGAYPVAERVMKEILSLPMFPELTKEQMDYVAQQIRGFNSKQ